VQTALLTHPDLHSSYYSRWCLILADREGSTLEWRATVDRIEDSVAVLVPEGRPGARLTLDRSLLPPSVRDGTVLRIRIVLDRRMTNESKREVAGIQAELEAEHREQ